MLSSLNAFIDRCIGDPADPEEIGAIVASVDSDDKDFEDDDDEPEITYLSPSETRERDIKQAIVACAGAVLIAVLLSRKCNSQIPNDPIRIDGRSGADVKQAADLPETRPALSETSVEIE